MIQQDIHSFQGMRRDNHPSRQNSKFLWEAHNIRFTAREDNTLLTLTNEKGNKNTGLNIHGIYLGHCIVGDYLVVFTTVNICRLNKSNGNWIITLLFNNSNNQLNLDVSHPIQALGIYEGKYVQKVYWVDGINQPRVINITKVELFNHLYPKDTTYTVQELYPNANTFNFVQNLKLNENISITRAEGDGSFSPGTIQYAFTYFNLYGQESNIFYTTELLYTSYVNRGGSGEDKVSNIFNITVSNIDTSFQFLRVYSIHRTSIDTTPTVKLVKDIELVNNNNNVINFIDDGTEGSVEDPTKLLYIGGEEIVAGCINQKDNTLFLGNITTNNQPVNTILKDKLKDLVVTESSRSITLKGYDENAFYSYSNQLQYGNTSTFKCGDTYRLGIQFQYPTGKWTDPIYIRDYPNNSRANINKGILNLPTFEINLGKIEADTSLSPLLKQFKRARGVIVLPTIHERKIVAQGILNPTVFSIKNRINNTPFSQASWFFRPMSKNLTGELIDKNNKQENVLSGSIIESRHLFPLGANKVSSAIDWNDDNGSYLNTKYFSTDRGAEIQNMEYKDFITANSEAYFTSKKACNTFFVDQSILTFNSPDIEFDDVTKGVIDNGDYELNIIGLIPFKYSAGDIDIQTSSPPAGNISQGFYHATTFTDDYSNRITASGLYYRSHMLDDKTSDNVNPVIYPIAPNDKTFEYSWFIYPWQRTGSLNNDVSRADGSTRTAVLKRKVISNIRVSDKNILFTKYNLPITKCKLFDSDEMSLIKVDDPFNIEGTDNTIGTINYYGNIDTLVTTTEDYPIWAAYPKGRVVKQFPFVGTIQDDSFITDKIYPVKTIERATADKNRQLSFIKDPVRLKYKSSPHAIFAIKGILNEGKIKTKILPKIVCGSNIINNNTINNDKAPFWYKKVSDVSTQSIDSNKSIIEVFCLVYGSADFPDTITSNIALKVTEVYENSSKVTAQYAICDLGDNTAYLYQRTGNTSWDRNSGNTAKTAEASNWVKITPSAIHYYTYGNDCYARDTATGNLKKLDSSSSDNPLNTDTANKAYQDTITLDSSIITNEDSFLYIAELVKKNSGSFGNVEDNLWIPAGKPVTLNVDNASDVVTYSYGDTYYQRYDCLKTMPYTRDDENSIVDIASFYVETHVNLDGRYDRNRGNLSNLNISNTNFNLLNNVYNQRDNFFNYRVLEKQLYITNDYPSQFIWSKQKTYLEKVDTWTNITLANNYDLDGSKGKLNSIEVYNDLLLSFQDKSISQILFNSRVQIPTSDNVPIEISNNYKLEGVRLYSDTIGCQDKYSIVKSPLGLYFIDNNTDTLYLFNGQLKDLSNSLGLKWYMTEHHSDEQWNIQATNAKYLSYDSTNRDLYISLSKDLDNLNALCYSEDIGNATSLMSYNNCVMFNMNDMFLAMKTIGNITYLYENFEGKYNNFFGKYIMPDFKYICNSNPTINKIFDTIEYRADIYNNDNTLDTFRSFDWIEAQNEYQYTGKKKFTQLRNYDGCVSLRKKFRVWRGQIPRVNRDRMRNLWTSIKLGFNINTTEEKNDFKLILHDISTKYSI